MQNDYLLLNPLVDRGILARLDRAGLRLLLVLMRRADASWACFMRNDNAAREAGVCRSDFYEGRRQLERLGLLTSSSDGRKTYYQLHAPGTAKKPETPRRSSPVRGVRYSGHQVSARADSPRRRSIASSTDSSSTKAAPAVPAEAAAVLARLEKNKVRPAKAREFAAAWPVPVLAWACSRLEKKKTHNPTGFLAKLLEEEGAERATAAAAELREREERETAKRERDEREARARAAAEDVDAMTRRAFDAMTPAQRVGLHARAAEFAPLASTRKKLQAWQGGEPMAVALALLRDDLAGRRKA